MQQTLPNTQFFAETGIFGNPRNINWKWWDTPENLLIPLLFPSSEIWKHRRGNRNKSSYRQRIQKTE